MLCPSCNKFPAFSTDTEPELEIDVESELELIEEGELKGSSNVDLASATINGTCRIVLTSECCGDECKETTFDVEVDDIEIKRAEGCICDLNDLSVTGDAQMTDRTETINAKGKPINPRYAKRFYGAEGTFEVACSCTKSSASVEWKDEVQASGMDELN